MLPAETESLFDACVLGFLVLVLSGVVARHNLVVAGERLVSGIRDAPLQNRQVEDAEQRVATADLRVEEPEREAGIDRLDPERDLGELHRHRVAVDSVDAASHHVAQRVAEVGHGRRSLGTDAGKPCRDTPGGRQQETV